MSTSERPDFIEQIRFQAGSTNAIPRANRKQRYLPDPHAVRYLFTVFDGNRWMELGDREPETKMLFGEFWHEGELCILFADTNVGKSILAVQIADSLTRRKQIAPFTLNAKPQKVLYVDFELTTKQFHARYSHQGKNYNFSDKFIRATFRTGAGIEMPEQYISHDELVVAGLEYRIRQLKATVVIIDNITCLRGGIENASVALSLMKNLKAFRNDLGLSILVLAHTPKRRNPTRPLSADDLQGSKLLINFADSAFAIGRSGLQKELCYLKQIKQRNTEQVYGADNVCFGRIRKLRGFLQFRFQGNGPEQPHLLRYQESIADSQRRQLAGKVLQLSASGLSQRRVSKELGISLGLVNKLMRLKDE